MKKIIDYIRCCFCKHEWKMVDRVNVVENEGDVVPVGKRWTIYCKKCGSFKTHKSY